MTMIIWMSRHKAPDRKKNNFSFSFDWIFCEHVIKNTALEIA